MTSFSFAAYEVYFLVENNETIHKRSLWYIIYLEVRYVRIEHEQDPTNSLEENQSCMGGHENGMLHPCPFLLGDMNNVAQGEVKSWRVGRIR